MMNLNDTYIHIDIYCEGLTAIYFSEAGVPRSDAFLLSESRPGLRTEGEKTSRKLEDDL